MSGCKRGTLLILAALATVRFGRPAAGAEPMRILTFVPGVATGRLPVTVDLGSAPPPAELLLDGRTACRVSARRQTCLVDLGPAPRVRLLELVRRAPSGRAAERVRRWVNKPSTARAEVLPRTDCVTASGPCTLSVAWSHEQDLPPTTLAVSIDGSKAWEGPVRDVPIPFAAERPVRIVSVDLSFVDGQKASETLLIGKGTSSAVEAPLNAVVVSTRGDAHAAPPAVGGRPIRAAETGESDALFIVAPSAVPKLLALEAAAQKSFTKTNARMARITAGITHILHFSPLATRASYRTAAEVTDRMFRLQGFDCTPRSGRRDLVLPCVDAGLYAGDTYRLAATVASAAFVRAATPRRRAVVVVLGDEEPRPDESGYGGAEARRYLSEILVPLEIWRVGSADGRAWGDGRRVSTAPELVDAWAALRTELDAQRIWWIAEDLDLGAFALAPGDAGIVLAGRSGGAAPLAVASASEPDEPGTPVAAEAGLRAGTPGAPSAKSVSASQTVGLVNLDAFVTDAKGRRLTGLSASDFALRIGGKPVAITNFSEYEPPAAGAASAPAAAGAAPSVRPRRRIVLFVDRLTLGDPRRSARFFGSLKDFVVRSIQPGDEAAVLTFDTSLATRVGFTGDVPAVLAALDALAKESARPPSLFTGTENSETLVAEIAQAEAEIAQREAGLRGGGSALPAPPAEARAPQQAPISPTVLAEARGLAMQEWARTKNKAAALRSVLSALGGFDGRRVLVVASHRLSRWSGLEYFLTKRLDVDVVVPPEAKEIDARKLLEDLAETANGYGVTLHGLYPEAGGDFDLSVAQKSTPQFTGQPMNGRRGIWIDANETDGLHLAVDPTGGAVAAGAEQAADALASAATDLESFYSLGFPVEGLAAGKSLAVDLRVAVPGAKVRTRRAVIERGPADRAADRTVSNLFSRVAAPGFAVTARVTATTPADKGRLRVAYEVAIPVSALALLPVAGGRSAKIAAFVALLDHGDVTQAPPARQEFKRSEDASGDANAHVTFTGEAVVNPGAVISIGILDEATQEAGFARIEVPGAAKT